MRDKNRLPKWAPDWVRTFGQRERGRISAPCVDDPHTGTEHRTGTGPGIRVDTAFGEDITAAKDDDVMNFGGVSIWIEARYVQLFRAYIRCRAKVFVISHWLNVGHFKLQCVVVIAKLLGDYLSVDGTSECREGQHQRQ